ncbi:hypothetical protein GQ43DRAFT_412999 [Delitschia confertaspora ATCC 74209]|uniref:ATP adenylyltransferase n=1 Tax=Delitschia confertaspora ATCC 74209 TaxID=1513339 RepID=A0A9P4JT69_9PLEO|nr:hypothetical protein GQ43DRAFT_412999 [Delitschia confertaspora ATCC 74209]
MENLSEMKILSTFEALVRDSILIYGPHEKIEKDYEGYPIEFRICPSLLKKPPTVGALLGASFNKGRKWGPGSDMYCPDERLILAKINNTHDFALNLFCVDKPQFILLTLDSYKRQHQTLDDDDFVAALEVLRHLDNIYIIFNCSENGGCSRVHKHMQGLRGPPKAFELFTQQSGNGASKVPFKYFMQRFSQALPNISASDVLNAYGRLLESSRGVLGLSQADDTCPHNVILWKDTMIVIPRRKGHFEQASANAAGMLGSVWVAERSTVEDWMRLGPRIVLQELGVPYSGL